MTTHPPTAQWRPPRDWTIQEWTDQVRALRRAALPLGILLPECLPGEPGDCGLPVAEHYEAYLGAIQARVQVLAEANLGLEGDAAERYFDAFTHFAAEYRKETGGEPR